jgi:hypothetical protein
MNRKLIYDLTFSVLITITSGLTLSQLKTYSAVLLVVYILFFIWFGYRSLTFAFKYKKAQSSIKADIDSRDSKLDLNPSLIPPFGFVVTFGLICHQLFLYDSSLFVINSATMPNSPYDYEWMIYAIDNFIRSVMFDFLETYHVKISQIDSNNNWILTFVFIFKSTLSIFFIKALLNLIKATKLIENQNKELS